MALRPQLAEDVLSLIQKYPNITPTQEVVLRLAATLLAEDEMGWDELYGDPDQRLQVNSDHFDLIPGSIEVINGLMSPKHWSTPKRLAEAKRERES